MFFVCFVRLCTEICIGLSFLIQILNIVSIVTGRCMICVSDKNICACCLEFYAMKTDINGKPCVILGRLLASTCCIK